MSTEENLIVGMCIDESGSMYPHAQATIDGFNAFVDGVRKQPGKTRLSVTKFSDLGPQTPTYREFCVAEKVKDVDALTSATYRPHGNTPLFDAIGTTVTKLERWMAENPGKANWPVQFVIQTDGFENASREYKREQIVELIQRKEADGWKFIYLGADQDEIEAADAGLAMGMSAGSTMSYASADTHSTYAGVVSASAGLRANPSMTSAEVLNETRAEHDKQTAKKKPTEPTSKGTSKT